MAADRVASLHVQGLRSLADVRLPLGPALTVLVGENGSGKSSLVEAFELVANTAAPRAFVYVLNEKHGGLNTLLRQNARTLRLAVRIEGAGGIDGKEPPLDYGFEIGTETGVTRVISEWLDIGPAPGHQEPHKAIHREGNAVTLFDPRTRLPVERRVGDESLVLGSFGTLSPAKDEVPTLEQRAIDRTRSALSGIDVRVPFETRPWWITKEGGRSAPLRESAIVQPVNVLARLGDNLATCLHALRNAPGDQWQETLEIVRLGLGQNVRDIKFPPDAGGGQIGVSLELDGVPGSIPAYALSDGQLTYLAFVVLARLGLDRRSLLVFDEPETHLHPELLRRVLQLFDEATDRHPVLLATQSGELLDMLEDPAGSVIVCSTEGPGLPTTSLARPDADALGACLRRTADSATSVQKGRPSSSWYRSTETAAEVAALGERNRGFFSVSDINVTPTATTRLALLDARPYGDERRTTPPSLRHPANSSP